jgi:DNA-binding response OmpR family regulator
MERHKVLIVDDDQDLLKVLHRKLTRAGFDVVCAEDGLSATSTAVRERPDVVLLDVQLPGGSGPHVLQRFRNLRPLAAVPVVVMSACTPEMGLSLLANGADEFLQKPVDPARLIETIHRVLGTTET